MYIKSKTKHQGAVLTGLILALLLVSAAWAPDGMAGSNSSGSPTIGSTEEEPLFPGYPLTFDVVSSIDRLTGKEAVVGDTLYRVSRSTSFHTPRQGATSRSRMRPGDVVGCLINADGEIESMWLLSRKKR